MELSKQDKKELFLSMMNYRHACKLFDSAKKVEQSDLDYILECGRLSPSSIGMEQWKFVVVKNEEVKQKLQEACFNQPQVGTASVVIAILAKKKELEIGSAYVDRVLSRMGESAERYKAFYPTYAAGRDIGAWANAQCHIPAANMMSAAAFIGVDSCPIAAFDPQAVSEVLGYDREDYEVSLVVPFGYRGKEAQPKIRLPMDEIAQIIN
jgi:nitroreductase